ncbi:VOC family protein [Tellurirhabdus rosea]|uniref:VOC family protein n=1 Tax=Tellurirhabdus rosea TaxID=2674997 RepID=UPI00224D92CB|nr:VOC family protein [Tellurirhabdus rosea]
MATTAFLGLRTVVYAAPDLEQTKNWYTRALGIQPYFDEPFYVGFSVGGYELGLDPNATPAPGSTITYWGVPSIENAWNHLLEQGATAQDEIQEVGEGIKVATVQDPFGNVLGIIENPHFKAE